MGRGRTIVVGLLVTAMSGPAARMLSADPQVSFEEAVRDLSSPAAATRLKTARLLHEAAYPEAAVPLARLIADPDDTIQLEAIAAELNIFRADKIVPRKRVGFVVEVRKSLEAEEAFAAGPLALGPSPVPMEVLTALLTAARDDNPRVRLEAVYAFGALAVEPGGARRLELLRVSGPDLAAMVGAMDPAHRYGALRVLGRVFARRLGDPPIDQPVGDAVVSALNEPDAPMRAAAMDALGAMRYERALKGIADTFQYHGKGGMAETALDALARIGHPSSVPQFVAQLPSKTTALRRIAIEGLARTGDATQLAGVRASLRDERNDSLLLAGDFAAAMLVPDAGESLAPIVTALSVPRLREQARGYLGTLVVGRAVGAGRYLGDASPAVRTDLVDALGESGDVAALPVVERLSSDHEPSVARAVERARARLGQLRPSGA
jgi:HEAT repeat protein